MVKLEGSDYLVLEVRSSVEVDVAIFCGFWRGIWGRRESFGETFAVFS